MTRQGESQGDAEVLALGDGGWWRRLQDEEETHEGFFKKCRVLVGGGQNIRWRKWVGEFHCFRHRSPIFNRMDLIAYVHISTNASMCMRYVAMDVTLIDM